MKKHISDPAEWKNSLGIFALLLMAVFVSELAVMELFSPLFASLTPVAGGLLDSSTVTLLCAAPIWLYLFRLSPPDPGAKGSGTSHLILFALALAGIFLAEFLVMLLLPYLFPARDSLTCDLADAALTSLFCALPLWRLLFRPEMRRRYVPLMTTPLRLYALLLFSVFLADLLQELLFPLLKFPRALGTNLVIDAFLTTLFGAPLLWLLVARPLKNAARSEKTRVAAVYSQVIDAIVVIDARGVVGAFNPAAEQIFGCAAREVLGESAALLLEGGEQALADLMKKTTRGADDRPNPLFNEFSCRRRDGLTLVMNVSISEILQPQGAEYLLIMRDMTSRKKMEQSLRDSETRFRQIFHQAEDAILFMKPGGCEVIDANSQAESIFGYSRAELLGGDFAQVCGLADPSLLAQTIGGVEEGKGVRHDFACRRKDGREIIVSLRGRRMLLQGAPVTYCTFRDITERLRMEERSREIQARLIQTNKMTSLGLLVSGVAHEINNPNNFILANCELLGRIIEDMLTALDEYGEGNEGVYLGGIAFPELGEHTRRLVAGIATGAHRVNDIITDLKGFARQEHNQQRHPVDLSQVARSAVSLLNHELIRYTDNFHLDLAEQLPPVTGHAQQIGQVIINLLMNACQALPGKGSGIWLATGFDHAGGRVYISVRDEGHGMSRDQSERVLEPFFTTKLESGGTGLGLSISDSIVKEHGGALEFSSEVGRGTTFTVSLPVAQLPAEEQT